MKPNTAHVAPIPWDLLVFLALVVGTMWLVIPLAGANSWWGHITALAALTVAVGSAVRGGVSPRELGFRLDNLLHSLAVYLAVMVPVAGLPLLLFAGRLRAMPWQLEIGVDASWLFLWALLQQFLLLGFILRRLRGWMGVFSPAAATAAGIFSVLHLPNPFLTLYTLAGGLVLCHVFRRWPNLWAAALAHALTSAIVGQALPTEITGGMSVGAFYDGGG